MGAYQYAEIIDRHLNSCEFLDDRPGRHSKVQIPEDNPNAFFWKEKFYFRDNKVLTVTDIDTFDADGDMLERDFAYDFRERGGAHPIWRVCNHCTKQSVDAPCHVHVEHDDNVIECFPDSSKTDFTYAIHCIKNFYLGKPQEWEEGGECEPGI